MARVKNGLLIKKRCTLDKLFPLITLAEKGWFYDTDDKGQHVPQLRWDPHGARKTCIECKKQRLLERQSDTTYTRYYVSMPKTQKSLI